MTDDLMTRARRALTDEDAARLEAKAEELATADERTRLDAEKEARHQKARADAEAALTAPGVALPDLARKFDAAVAALVDLAQAADDRNAVTRRHGPAIEAHQIPDAESVDTRELVARAVVLATEQLATPDNGLGRLTSGLLGHSGPVWRQTVVERAQR